MTLTTRPSVSDDLARIERRARDLAADPTTPPEVREFLSDDLLAVLQRAGALLSSYAFTNAPHGGQEE